MMIPEGTPVNRSRRAHEFAELTGVTVRALHHYDSLGLLRPRRTASGYRMYGERELERLEQIVALKFIGIPLKQIKAMLDREAPELAEALRMQRSVLEQKRRLLDRQSRRSARPSSRSRRDGGPTLRCSRKSSG
jgi:DNA-binding transcriptional MerR regulator